MAAGIAGIGGALISGRSSKRAANAAAAGSNAATAESRRQFDTALELQRPAIDAGNQAREQLLSLLGIGGDGSAAIDQIRNTPGFQFQLEQGTRGLNAQRGAGNLSGGNVARDFARFNQGVASNFYTDFANRLASLAGTGQTASAQSANNAINTGAINARSLQNAGNARASGIIGQGNALGNGINDFAQFLGDSGFNGFGRRTPTFSDGGIGRFGLIA